jgi:hypothetical protein
MEKVQLEPQRRELLQQLYSPQVRRLKELFPDLDLSLWRNYADLAEASPTGAAAAVS